MNKNYMYATRSFEEATIALSELNPSFVVVGRFECRIHKESAKTAAEAIVRRYNEKVTSFEAPALQGRVILPDTEDVWCEVSGACIAFGVLPRFHGRFD